MQRRLREGQLWQASMTACSCTPCRSGRIMAVCSWSSVRGPACVKHGDGDMQWSSVVLHLIIPQSGMNQPYLNQAYSNTLFVVFTRSSMYKQSPNRRCPTLLGTPMIESCLGSWNVTAALQSCLGCIQCNRFVSQTCMSKQLTNQLDIEAMLQRQYTLLRGIRHMHCSSEIAYSARNCTVLTDM